MFFRPGGLDFSRGLSFKIPGCWVLRKACLVRLRPLAAFVHGYKATSWGLRGVTNRFHLKP